MSYISFAPTGTRHTSHIYQGPLVVGLLSKETSHVGADGPYYVIDLHGDPRGPKRVRNRSLVAETIEDRITTHPAPWKMLRTPAAIGMERYASQPGPTRSSCIPF